MIIVRRKDGKPLRDRPPVVIEEVADPEARVEAGARIVDADPEEVIVIMRGPRRGDDPYWRPPIMMFEDKYSPEELARSQGQAERFERNAAWLEAHGEELFTHHRGKYVCVAGLEPFISETASEAIAMAKAAHPDDDGRFLYRVPKDKSSWLYARHAH